MGIKQRNRMAVAMNRQTIFQNERGDAPFLKPLRLVGAFMLEGEHPIATTGADDDGRGGCGGSRWKKKRERGEIVRTITDLVRGGTLPKREDGRIRSGGHVEAWNKTIYAEGG